MTYGRHPAEDALLDAVEGTADASVAEHVRGCAECRQRVEAAREALGESRAFDVPEPAPEYWDAFRREVGQRLDREPSRAGLRFWAPAFATLAAALVLAVGLSSRVHAPPQPDAEAARLPAWSPLPEMDDDAAAAAIGALAREDGIGASVTACEDLDCLDGLSEDETRAAAAELRAEIEGRRL
jgi:hypothetical protein